MITDDLIEGLKKNSDYYPEIWVDNIDGCLYASTLVRIERDGTWYVVHCIESIIPNYVVMQANLIKRLVVKVHDVYHLYKITGAMEEVDALQISERDRLLKKITPGFADAKRIEQMERGVEHLTSKLNALLDSEGWAREELIMRYKIERSVFDMTPNKFYDKNY